MTVVTLGKGEKFKDPKDALTSILWQLFNGSEVAFHHSRKDSTAVIRYLKKHGFEIVKKRRAKKK